MKSLVYALLGVVLYAIQNTIIDVRLKQYSTVSLLVGWYIILLPLAVGLYVGQKYFGDPLILPTGSNLKLLIAVAVMFFIADFFYIGAFTSGGNAVSITILTVLIPVIAGAIKYVWVKETPTPYHFIALAFALLAVVFVGVGNSKKPVEVPAPAVLHEIVR